MGSAFSAIAPFLVPLVVGVVSFFAYRFLWMARQIADLHVLKTHGEEASLKDLHQKMDRLITRQQAMEEIVWKSYYLLEKE